MNTDKLNEVQRRLVYMSEGLAAIGLAASNSGDEAVQHGLGSAVYSLALALDDLTLRLEDATQPELQEVDQ